MATEKRLIDANALMDTIKKRTTTEYPNELWGLMLAQDFVESATTMDAVEVVHGRWGEYEVFKGAASLNGYPCSACGKRVSAKTNYCPNCGADMRERKDNG